MYIRVHYIVLFMILLPCSALYPQDTVRYEQSGNEFEAVFNNDDYTSSFTISSGGKYFYTERFDRVTSITGYSLTGSQEKDIVIETYTGGAHCCTILYIGELKGRSFRIRDTVYLGNSGYEIKDINGNRKFEITAAWDGFAYAFTAYAFSRFPMIVYGYTDDGRLSVITGDFKEQLRNEVESYKSELKEVEPYTCPQTEDDSFSSGAGETKAILAAIVYDYVSLGEAEKGYSFVNETYNCPDKEKFIEDLKYTFNLK